MTAENLTRSTKAPTMRPGVMIAKVIWNMKKTPSGIVPLSVELVTPERKAFDKSPIQALPDPKAREYRPTIHKTDARQAMAEEIRKRGIYGRRKKSTARKDR